MSGVSTRYLYDGADIIGTYNASGALLKRYVHGPADDEPLVSFDNGADPDAKTWLLEDAQGSVIAGTAPSGLASFVNSYDEYGQPGPNNAGAFQYTGQVWLPFASVYHYKARAYDPAIGRFLQTDPILFDGGMNLYAYVGNDPVNGSDPSGLGGCTPAEGPNCFEVTATRPPPSWWSFGWWLSSWLQSGGWNASNASGFTAGAGATAGKGDAAAATPPPNCPAAIPSITKELGAFGLGLGDAFSFGLYSNGMALLYPDYANYRQLGGYNLAVGATLFVSGGRLIYAQTVSLLSTCQQRTPSPFATPPRVFSVGWAMHILEITALSKCAPSTAQTTPSGKPRLERTRN